MLSNKQTGFTLIEVIIVLAITGLLLLIGLLGQGAVRQRAQFTDAMQTLDSEIDKIKTESATTLNTAGAGDSVGTVVFGSLIVFGQNSEEYIVKTLSHADPAPGVVTTSYTANVVSERTVDLRWNVDYISACSEVVDDPLTDYCTAASNTTNTACLLYYRSLTDGRLLSTAMSGSECETSAGVFSFDPTVADNGSTYVQYLNSVAIRFGDGSREAVLLVDNNSANGSVEVKEL